MCDGTYMYPSKGGQSIKLTKPTILVTGNKDPREVYPNTYALIEARFNVMCADNYPDARKQKKDNNNEQD